METWTYEWAVRNLIAQLLMPPGIWLWLILLPFFLSKKRELLQKALIVFSVLMIWLTSTNYLAVQLTNVFGSVITWSPPLDLKVLEDRYYSKLSEGKSASRQGGEQAIVILGGGRRSGAIEYPEYEYQNIKARAMERVRYGGTLSNNSFAYIAHWSWS
jgi:uncharacterized SAM-binding protein YcdF (DUF218 family)